MTCFRCVLLAVSAATAFAASAAHASTITINGVDHDESAFIDGVTLNSGSFQAHLAPTPEAGLIGGDTSTAIQCVVDSGPCSFTAHFIDNVAFNGTGNDIVLYAVGGSGHELFDISINGVTLANQGAQLTGEMANGYALLAYALDLDLFGVAANAVISSLTVTIGRGGVNPEDFVAFAALNNEKTLVNPVPGAIWLFGTALAGVGLFGARRRKKMGA